MQQPQQRHAIVTCYDPRLDPIVEIYKQNLILKGHTVLTPIRPVGGVHAMTRSACRHFFYDQLDGLIVVGKATHLHIFPHTNCQYGWLKVREKIGDTSEQDLAFQVDMLKKSCEGARIHVKEQFPKEHIAIIGGIILTQSHRVITLEEALDLLPHRSCHEQRSPDKVRLSA